MPYSALVAYLQASHTHAHATHASRHFPNHHACIPICTCDFSNAQLCLPDQLYACTSMPHIHPPHPSHIDFLTHSLFGRAERYYFY